jgi:hypothetical protein
MSRSFLAAPKTFATAGKRIKQAADGKECALRRDGQEQFQTRKRSVDDLDERLCSGVAQSAMKVLRRAPKRHAVAYVPARLNDGTNPANPLARFGAERAIVQIARHLSREGRRGSDIERAFGEHL